MNLIELQTKSTAELRDIYNGLVDKQIKRFAERVEAERRTAIQLQEAGKWEGPLPDGKNNAKGVKVEAAKPKGKAASKAAKSAAAAKPAPKAAKGGSRAPRQPRGDAGAPRVNASYRVLKADAKMNEGSARTKVFTFIAENGKTKKGIDRESIENHFVDDETVNVKASLDYLVKVEIISVVQD